MTTAAHTFVIEPIPAEVVATLLQRDDADHAPRFIADGDGGSPLRCGLRVSKPGERITLVSYAPLRRWAKENGADPGAFDETGPIFIHAEPCAGPPSEGYPDELRAAPRMLRAYTHEGTILRATHVHAFGDFEGALDEMFRDPRVAIVHVRAFEAGCFTFAATR